MAIPTYSERAAIADAVAALISAASTANVFGSVHPTVQRVWACVEDLPNIPNAQPLVAVVAIGPEKREILSRRTVQKDFEILIGIEQRLPQSCNPLVPSGNSVVDAMVLFSEQIAAILEPNESSNPIATGILLDQSNNKIAAWIESKVMVYNYARLRGEQRTYTSAITATYKRL